MEAAAGLRQMVFGLQNAAWRVSWHIRKSGRTVVGSTPALGYL